MLYLAVAQLVVIVALCVLLRRQETDKDKTLLEMERENRQERYDLVTRIQHPGFAPPGPRRDPQLQAASEAERELHERLAKVGTVTHANGD